MNDLYEILGVENSATGPQIKKAHRKLVTRLHLDKNRGITSQEFLDVQKAYEILSNPKTRETYDEYGFTEADNKYQMLAGLARTLIQGCIKAGTPPKSLTRVAGEELSRSLRKLKENKAAIEQDIDKLRVQKDCVKAKKSLRMDLIGDTILGMISEKEAERLVAISGIDLHEALIDIINKYEKEPPPATVNSFGGTAQGFGSSWTIRPPA